MPPTTPCPDAQVLQDLLLGRLPGSAGEPLYRHLEECARCTELALTFHAGDWLLDALRAQAGQTEAEDAAVVGLIRTLRCLGPPRPGPETGDSDPGKEQDADKDRPTVLFHTPQPQDEGAEGLGDLCGFLAPTEGPDEIGRLGPYRILKVLGAGGMGVVFQAEDPALQRSVALKAMRPTLAASGPARRRFLREARAAAALEHDHVVAIYQVGEDRGIPFLAMQLLKGESLECRLKRERVIAVAEVLRIGRETARGLAAAHKRGLIHRDIKPANIWLEARGDKRPACPPGTEPTSAPLVGTGDRVKLLDFGLARSTADTANLTQSRAIVGTPAYMAPEQAQGTEVDPRADLFSLGCVLYHLCTGEPPFKGQDSLSLLLAVAQDHPRPPRERNPAVPQALSDLILRLLAKARERRPPSAQAVVEAIEVIEGGQTLRLPPSRPRRRRSRLPFVAGFLLLTGLVPGALLVLRNRDAAPVLNVPGPEAGVAAKPADQVAAVVAGLKERNPGFDGKVTYKVAQDVVTELQFVTDCVTDISPLRALSGLRTLDCSGSDWRKGQLADLSPLEGMKLTWLFFGDTQVADLAPLKGMKLAGLGCNWSRVSDLSPLEGMPLTDLHCGGTQVSDLSPLRGMRLNVLCINDTPVSDLSPLKDMKLTEMRCGGTRVCDLSPLNDMKLTLLWCYRLRVPDLSLVRGMPLREIWCDFQPGRDAELLRSLKTLETINRKPARDFWKEVEGFRPGG